jgi:hypothetical protein
MCTMKLSAFTKAASVIAIATQMNSAEAQQATKVVEGVERNGIVTYNLPTLRISKSNGFEFLTTGGTTKVSVQGATVAPVSPKVIFDRNVMCLPPQAAVPVACPTRPCMGEKDKHPSTAGPACQF